MMTAYLLLCLIIFCALVTYGIHKDQQGENAAEIGSNMSSPIFWWIVALCSVPFINIVTFIVVCVVAAGIKKPLHEDDKFL